ncbi:hypothetical protein CQA63_09180 [Helicobacter marmotae]|uniref:Uncharacterized protein n=1 Tax=Helicobacter marmotae TaxID=152490 RepID=A0A3D8I148_9HELI|nr:hypothetical protein CQA63_09180 [Helicobacter marmotae]
MREILRSLSRPPARGDKVTELLVILAEILRSGFAFPQNDKLISFAGVYCVWVSFAGVYCVWVSLAGS